MFVGITQRFKMLTKLSVNEIQVTIRIRYKMDDIRRLVILVKILLINAKR